MLVRVVRGYDVPLELHGRALVLHEHLDLDGVVGRELQVERLAAWLRSLRDEELQVLQALAKSQRIKRRYKKREHTGS